MKSRKLQKATVGKVFLIWNIRGRKNILQKSSNQFMSVLVFLTMALSGFVFIEPAPYDLLMMFLILVTMPKLMLDIVKWDSKSLLICFWGFALMNIVPAINVDNYRVFIKFSGVTLYLMLSALWIKNYLQKTRNFKLILTGIIVASLIATISGLLPYFGVNIEWALIDGMRARGTFKDPNVFAPFLLVPIFFLFDKIRTHEKTLIDEVIVIILHIGVLYSFSRGAWVAYMITGICYLAFFIKELNKNFIFKAIRVMTSILLISVILLNITGKNEFFLSRLGLKSYDNDRFGTQLAAITGKEDYSEKVTEHLNQTSGTPKENNKTTIENSNDDSANIPSDTTPEKNNNGNSEQVDKKHSVLTKLIGIGPGQFELSYPMSAHSIYVRTYTENGVIGLLFLGGLFVLLIGKLYKRCNIQIISGLSPKTVIALLLGVAINAVVIDIIHWRHAWLLIGIALMLVDNTDDAVINDMSK